VTRNVTTATLLSAVEKFVVKEGKPAKTNIPEKWNSIDPQTLRQIQELQQQVERVELLTALKVIKPEATAKILDIIKE
jgi:hypothetical protein